MHGVLFGDLEHRLKGQVTCQLLCLHQSVKPHLNSILDMLRSCCQLVACFSKHSDRLIKTRSAGAVDLVTPDEFPTCDHLSAH